MRTVYGLLAVIIFVVLFYWIGLDKVFFKTETSFLQQPSVTEWLQDYESERRFQEGQNRVLSMFEH